MIKNISIFYFRGRDGPATHSEAGTAPLRKARPGRPRYAK